MTAWRKDAEWSKTYLRRDQYHNLLPLTIIYIRLLYKANEHADILTIVRRTMRPPAFTDRLYEIADISLKRIANFSPQYTQFYFLQNNVDLEIYERCRGN